MNDVSKAFKEIESRTPGMDAMRLELLDGQVVLDCFYARDGRIHGTNLHSRAKDASYGLHMSVDATKASEPIGDMAGLARYMFAWLEYHAAESAKAEPARKRHWDAVAAELARIRKGEQA